MRERGGERGRESERGGELEGERERERDRERAVPARKEAASDRTAPLPPSRSPH